MKNDTGSWRLFTGLEVHTNPHYIALACTSYAGYLTFVKNKLHRGSLKIPNKLDTRLDHFEINQMGVLLSCTLLLLITNNFAYISI